MADYGSRFGLLGLVLSPKQDRNQRCQLSILSWPMVPGLLLGSRIVLRDSSLSSADLTKSRPAPWQVTMGKGPVP